MIPLADVSWNGLPGYGTVPQGKLWRCDCFACRVGREVARRWRP